MNASIIYTKNAQGIYIHAVNTEPRLNINRIDLNLLVYLDALLRERNVTQAANQLSLSQPAMSNGLRRLRELFDDPLLVRTSEGMTPTERALELEPVVREVLTHGEEEDEGERAPTPIAWRWRWPARACWPGSGRAPSTPACCRPSHPICPRKRGSSSSRTPARSVCVTSTTTTPMASANSAGATCLPRPLVPSNR